MSKLKLSSGGENPSKRHQNLLPHENNDSREHNLLQEGADAWLAVLPFTL
jgi:hypothetical protein